MSSGRLTEWCDGTNTEILELRSRMTNKDKCGSFDYAARISRAASLRMTAENRVASQPSPTRWTVQLDCFGSIFRGALDPVDDDNFDGALGFDEPKAKLLLECGEE
jgi:hypothetical protein